MAHPCKDWGKEEEEGDLFRKIMWNNEPEADLGTLTKFLESWKLYSHQGPIALRSEVNRAIALLLQYVVSPLTIAIW